MVCSEGWDLVRHVLRQPEAHHNMLWFGVVESEAVVSHNRYVVAKVYRNLHPNGCEDTEFNGDDVEKQ